MKKIPTLFKREFDDKHRITGITREFTDGLEEIFDYECIPTIKMDGSACMIRDGILYKRYDAKRGKSIPSYAIPCQESPDEITGHFPHWLRCERDNPADKWFFDAFDHFVSKLYTMDYTQIDGTYEAVGPHFNGNKHKLFFDVLRKHGDNVIYSGYDLHSFDGIKQFLTDNKCEGIVYWKRGIPVCKIKRSDFGLEW